jgi:hypothetical protein
MNGSGWSAIVKSQIEVRLTPGWTPSSFYAESTRFIEFEEFTHEHHEFLAKYHGEIEVEPVAWRLGLRRATKKEKENKSPPMMTEQVEEVPIASNMSRTLQALDLDLGQRS